MRSRRELVAGALRLAADLDAAGQELRREPGALDRVLAERPARRAAAPAGLEAAGPDPGTAERGRRLLEAGFGALDRLRRDEHADLRPEEELGLEAVILCTARPAIRFDGGRFRTPPPPWGDLEQRRDRIDAAARSVGRIQVPGLPTVPYGGTGFLVAEDVLMTNCHVAQLFARPGPDRGWVFRPELGPSVDFAVDPGADPPVELAVREVIGLHDRVDLALLRVDVQGGPPPPAPLTLMAEPPPDRPGRRLYVLGYPAPDPRNDPVVLRQIFGDVYFAKRLQPGAFLAPAPGPVIRVAPFSAQTADGDVFAHDASTLGGNSGSCVVDLDTDLVIGLHYAGRYTEYNQAVALWTLREDPLLRRAGVRFG